MTATPQGPTVFGDLLSGLSKLSPESRANLASEIGFDADIRDIVLGALTSSNREALFSSIAELWIEEAYNKPVAVLVPILSRPPAEAIEPIDLPRRAYNALVRRGLTTWQDVAARSPADLFAMRNLGKLSIREVLVEAMRRAYTYAVLGPPDTEDEPNPFADEPNPFREQAVPKEERVAARPKDPVLAAIGVALAWGRTELRVDRIEDVLARIDGPDTPSEVRSAFNYLGRIDLGPLWHPYAGAFDVDSAVSTFLEELTGRESVLVRERILSLDRPPTLEEIGRRFDVTRERARQIEAKTLRKFNFRRTRRPAAILVRTAMRARNAIGVAFPMDKIGTHTDLTQILGGANLDTDRARLLLWLAGPYQGRDGWLLLRGAQEAGTQALLAALEGEPIPDEAATGILEEHGFVADAAIPWMDQIPHVKRREGLVMLWGSTAGDRAVSVLTATGVPMTLNDLATEMDHRFPRGLANSLLADPRIMRTGLKHFGLRTWDYNEYTNIAEEIEEELTARGGEAPLEEIVRVLVDRFGVAAASVRSYAAGRQFERKRGMVRVRNESPFDPDAFARAVEYTPGCFRLDGGWAWRLSIAEDLARGSGRLMPAGFAYEIGLVPGASMLVPWEYGEVRLSWAGNQPQCGSIRQAILANNMAPGDLGFLQWKGESAEFHFVAQRDPQLLSTSVTVQLRHETGGAGRHGEGDLVADLARSLGFADAPVASARSIVRRLRARREAHLVQLFDQAVAAGEWQ